MKGRIHSFETMGTVDGPGIRFVTFFQGCRMKCLYCHNRDTWNQEGGELYTVEEIISRLKPLKNFYKPSNGGFTATGGEPLLQSEFITELFKAVKKEGLTTCIDTAGNVEITKSVEEAVNLADYVLFDIKATEAKKHFNLTNCRMEVTRQFADLLRKSNAEIWLRYVLLPGYTDSEQDLQRLTETVNSFKNATRIDILPYHTMGVEKWHELGYEYKLKGIQPPSADKLEKFKNFIKENTDITVK
jgi:pyruvate formate lyase activating enzyme